MIAFAMRGPPVSHGCGAMDGPGPIVRCCGICGGGAGFRRYSMPCQIELAIGLTGSVWIAPARTGPPSTAERSASPPGCLSIASRSAFVQGVSDSEWGSSGVDVPLLSVTPPRIPLPGRVHQLRSAMLGLLHLIDGLECDRGTHACGAQRARLS